MKCQQFELYGAEDHVSKGRTFQSVKEVQDFILPLRDTQWWYRWYHKVKDVQVFRLPSGPCSVGAFHPEDGVAQLELLPSHLNELTVLHELSHALAHARFGHPCSHSPWFARVYLEVVYHVMGVDTYTELKNAFVAANIEHDIPEKDHDPFIRRFGPITKEER